MSLTKEEGGLPPVTTSFFMQLKWLGWRERLALQRDKAGTFIPFFITGFLHVIFSVIFLGVGSGNSENVVKLTSHAGAVTFITVSAMFGTSQTALLTFPFERPLFLRESANGTQHPSAHARRFAHTLSRTLFHALTHTHTRARSFSHTHTLIHPRRVRQRNVRRNPVLHVEDGR